MKLDKRIVFLLLIFFGSIFSVSAFDTNDISIPGKAAASSSSDSSIIKGLTTLGAGVKEFMTTEEALYVVYFFAFMFTSFQLLNLVFQGGFFKNGDVYGNSSKSPFKGKPGKVLSFILSIMITSAIFYGKDYTDVIKMFNNIGGFIFIFVIAAAAIAYGVFLFKKNKEEHLTLAMFLLAFFTYIGTSLLLPHFAEKYSAGKVYEYGGSVIFGAGSDVVRSILDGANTISYLLMFIYGIVYLFSFFKTDENTDIKKSFSSKDSEIHEKRIEDFKHILNSLMNELKDVNNHFNNKVNLLNYLRPEIKRLRDIDKKQEGGN